ncbi:fatty acid CoA ligase family protein [Kitasatospora sp. NPDC052896]|uniref:fatty acid CoA ligase family protein n=1 Tax=Kitasatospora sp. NPDC052896 TaxID=3364061 RepID=UPI0037C9ED45
MTVATEPLSGELGLAEQLARNARAFPEKTAIIHPTDGREPDGRISYGEMTYRHLQCEVELLADALGGIGIGSGTRTVLMAAPGPELFALLFALFRLGAVPVVVDPGMGVRRMLHCYRAVRAEAFVGPPVAHAVRAVGRRAFADVRIRVTLGRRWGWGGQSLTALRTSARTGPAERPAVRGDDLMMIGFTTGSTGPAKGVEFTHRMMTAMARAVRAAHARDRSEVSLVTLPLYGALDLLFGSTLVLAPLAPSRVGQADPAALLDAMTRFRTSTLFASPALLRRLAEHLSAHPTPLPELRCVVSGGAPVPPELVATLRRVLDGRAAIHVTYGATEALPITSIESAEILAETAAGASLGAGSCVGRPVPGTELRILPVSDGPLRGPDASLPVPTGAVGEIVVAGESVSRRYHAAPAADAAHKVVEQGDGAAERIWHRTGDLGYLDPAGRLWFCGRKSQRVRTRAGDLHTVRCEGVLNAHPLVRRTALVGVGAPGAQRPVVCVETEPGVRDVQWTALVAELRALAAARPETAGLTVFLRHPGFPVDIRHNAKIGRERLARWAAGRLGPSRARALRAVPLAGWAYLAAGLLHPVDQPVLVALWWLDAVLSVLGHAVQLPKALSRGRAAGRSPGAAAVLTMLYGATWWRLLPAAGAEEAR